MMSLVSPTALIELPRVALTANQFAEADAYRAFHPFTDLWRRVALGPRQTLTLRRPRGGTAHYFNATSRLLRCIGSNRIRF